MYCRNCLSVLQDSKVDAAKSDKMSASNFAAPKQNRLDIVSITSDGCEIPFAVHFLVHTFRY